MEGHRFGMEPGAPEIPKKEKGERASEMSPADEIGKQAESVGTNVDAARHDAENAERMLADIKDPAAREKFAAILARLRGRVDGFGDPKKIAQAMIDKLGPASFEKRPPSQEELN